MTGQPPSVPGYRLGAQLGRGAMGVVHRAVHEATSAQVAIKTVTPTDPRGRAALETEILAMAGLNHRNLLYLHDYGLVEGVDQTTFWLATELASGGSLEGCAPHDWDEVHHWLQQIFAGLAHAHARGRIHRDLKPENLLRATEHDHRPGLKIADFGLTVVRAVSPAVRHGGTPQYLPPEQARPGLGNPGPWSDLYALGAVIWQWVCGQPPFRGEAPALIRQHCDAPLPTFRPRLSVPDELEPVLRWMLAKTPTDRPATVAQVREALWGSERSWDDAIATAASGSSSARLPGIGVGLLALRRWRQVGRAAERTTLIETLRQVTDEARPAIALISGPEGVGKTRLLHWLAETAAEAGVARVVWKPTDVGRALEHARSEPTLVCFDDLEEDDVQLLASLAFAGLPVLGLATTRSAQAWPELDELPGFRHLPLGPLEPPVFRDLLQSELGVSGPLTIRLDAPCGYVPGRAITWLQALAQQGRLQPSPDGWVVDDGHALTPPSLNGRDEPWLQDVLDACSADARRALRIAALLDPEVDDAEWLAALRKLGLEVPRAALHELARAGLIERRDHGFVWSSPTLQQVVLAPAPTAEEHLAVATVLQGLPDSRALRLRRGRHLLGAGHLQEGWATLVSLEDGIGHSGMEITRQAVEALRPHLHVATPLQRVRFLLMELLVTLNLVSSPDAIPIADALLAAVGTTATTPTLEVDPDLRRRALEAVARIYAFEDLPDKALPVLDALPDTPDALRGHAMVLGHLGRRVEAEALYRQALALTEHPRLQARLANGIACTIAEDGRYEESLDWFQRSLDLLEPEHRFVILSNRASSLMMLGRFDEALDDARAAFEASQHFGAHRVASRAVVYGIAAALADEDELERIADQALFSARRYDSTLHPPVFERLREATPTREATRAFIDALLVAVRARSATAAG